MFGAFSFFFLLKVESETKCQPAIKERKKEKVKILLRGVIFH